MNRYNIFGQVHKGLRALLYETALNLQQTDFTDGEASEAALEKLEITIDLFEKHAHTEDNIVFAAIEPMEASLVDAFEYEHMEDQILAEHLRDLQNAFVHSVSDNEKAVISDAIQKAFIDFMIFNLKHMAKEEDIINKALWKYFSDIELLGIAQKIKENTSPYTMSQFSRCMMRGLSNSEISAWLQEVKNSAPDFAFQSLMKIATEELEGHRWLSVQETITDGALVA